MSEDRAKLVTKDFRSSVLTQESSLDAARLKVSQLEQSIETVIKGKSESIRLALACLLARGHLLIEDVPGVGKTTLAHALARSLDCSFKRMQFTSDLLPSDVLGIVLFNQSSGEFEFKRGPIFSNVVLVDEINRTTPKTQSALLEAMSEGKVTVEDQTYSLPAPFLVVATQNPIEHHGTYPLPESQLDRFLMRIRLGYPSRDSEKEILKQNINFYSVEELRPILSGAEVLVYQREIENVKVTDVLVDYLMALVEATRRSAYLSLGISPRGALALYHAAQAYAFIDGRSYCIPDDIKRLTLPVFAHRVVVSSKYSSALKKTEEAEAIIEELVRGVEVPL
ncbi:MAG: AAA family ATPase [Acidobacteriota bacterium]